jgi:hypothetical protein
VLLRRLLRLRAGLAKVGEAHRFEVGKRMCRNCSGEKVS